MNFAFKEWEVVCEALASGRQTILLRKGGIHEGREGFSFAHDSFYLFPTKFHAQNDHVREGAFAQGKEWQIGDNFLITHYAKAVLASTLTEWSQVESLLPFHIYTQETLRERFDWKGKGMASGSIHVALVMVFKLDKAISLTYEKRFGGCRSWLEIPIDDKDVLVNSTPVVEDSSFRQVKREVERALEAIPGA